MEPPKRAGTEDQFLREVYQGHKLSPMHKMGLCNELE
jgi:hypothetical protein